MSETLYVHAGWLEDALIGALHVLRSNGKETVGFEYDGAWLRDHGSVHLDPDLLPFSGRQYPPARKALFGMLSDVCPDRWGRRLIQRREEIEAMREGRAPRHLHEMDYLTGISDALRTGGLRFRRSPDAPFIAWDPALKVPPLAGLHRLEQAALNYETSENPYETRWLSQLLSPGSSLGGARPKANVRDEEGALWIAKFPSKNDDLDVGAWEYTAHELALRCGLDVPEAMLKRFARSSYGSTFLVRRFDRAGGGRVHFASAMTLLGRTDGDPAPGSYLDIVELIASYGEAPAKDMEELFRRVAFSIAVSNHDDHLRNHGFLLGAQGWRLSPAYDINPSLDDIQRLSLNVTLDSSLSSFDLLQGTAAFYQLSDSRAREIIGEVRDVVGSQWEGVARESGIPAAQIRRMRPCFGACARGGGGPLGKL